MKLRWKELTARQKRIALLAIEGKLNRFGIGRELGVSRSAVVLQLGKIYRLLGVRDVIELAFEMGRHWDDMTAGDGDGDDDAAASLRTETPRYQ